MLRDSHPIDLFAFLGKDVSKVYKDLFCVIQQFTCELYGHKEDDSIVSRYKLYAPKHGYLGAKITIPCCLIMHASRTSY